MFIKRYEQSIHGKGNTNDAERNIPMVGSFQNKGKAN